MARRVATWLSPLALFLSLAAARGPIIFEEDGTLSITCNARAAELDLSCKPVRQVSLSLVEADGRTLKRMAVVQHRQDLIIPAVLIESPEFIREGWKFALPSKTEVNGTFEADTENRNLMTIVAWKEKVDCRGGGVFDCKVVCFLNSQSTVFHTRLNYKPVGRQDIKQIQMTPFNPFNAYKSKLVVTVKCIGLGPQDFTFHWSKRCPVAQLKPWPDHTSRVHKPVQRIAVAQDGKPSACKTYEHTQEVSFRTEVELNNCQLECKLTKGQALSRSIAGKITVYVSPSGDVTTREMSSLTMTCNAQTAGVDEKHKNIVKVTLTNHMQHGINVMASIQLKTRDEQAASTKEFNYTARQWTFTQPSVTKLTDPPNDTWNLMTITAAKQSATCSDSGYYKCAVQYDGNGDNNNITEVKKQYVVAGLAEIASFSLEPEAPGNQYENGAHLALTCVGLGPKSFGFRWESNCPQAHMWPGKHGQVRSATKQIIHDEHKRPSDCKTYKHSQEVLFMAIDLYHNCSIICWFGRKVKDFREEHRSVVIFLKNPAPPKPERKADNNNNSKSVLIASVLSALFLLLLLAIIVCVCVYRYRKRKANAYDFD